MKINIKASDLTEKPKVPQIVHKNAYYEKLCTNFRFCKQ